MMRNRPLVPVQMYKLVDNSVDAASAITNTSVSGVCMTTFGNDSPICFACKSIRVSASSWLLSRFVTGWLPFMVGQIHLSL